VFVDESGAREMCWSTRLVLVMEAGAREEMCWSTRLVLVMEAGGFDMQS
jgi:hypothetical protein